MSMYGNGPPGGEQQMVPDTHMGGLLDDGGGNLMNDVDMVPFDLNLNGVHDMDMQSFAPVQHPSQDPSDIKSSVEDSSQQTQTGNPITGAGAGPLPASFGIQGPSNSVADFTKRRNWSQRVLEEIKDFLHILTPDGCMTYVSPSAKSLTGHEPSELIGKFIFEFIHPDDSSTYVREFNESIATGNPLRFFYRFRRPDGKYTVFESFGHPHVGSEAANFGPNASASFCRGFFMMARPYPTKNAALLDSFLEHKIENERLRKRIADLKREEQEEMETQQRQWAKSQEGAGVTSLPSGSPNGRPDAASRDNVPGSATPATPNNYKGSMPPPAKPTVSQNALTRQNLDEALASSKPDSINDKMARYEGATHIETIEMLTGLRYRDGERSEGISTGATSPALIRGDQGIAIMVDKDGNPAQSGRTYSNSPLDAGSMDKKKKMKVADEYVCTDCGTLDSPEWRKGPAGPKTLCNACGLRWAKKEKKTKGGGPDSNGPGSASGPLSVEPGVPPQGTTPVQPSPLQNVTPPQRQLQQQQQPMPGALGQQQMMPVGPGGMVSMPQQQQQQPSPLQQQQQQQQLLQGATATMQDMPPGAPP